MASNFIYSATNAHSAVTVLRVRQRERVSAKRKGINWLPVQVKTMALKRKSGSTR